MPEIFLIGKSVLKKEYKDVLESKGHKIKGFASLKEALPKLKENPDLLIVHEGKDNETGFKEFLKESRNIPKIVVSDIHGIPKYLIKEPLTYPLLSPGERELNFAVNRLLRESLDHKRLKNNSSLLKQELDFCEGINRTLFSCKNIEETLNTIMKKAKDMTKAEGWSVFLVDEETGELISDIKDNKATKEMQKFRIKIGEGIAGWVAKECFPTIVPDVSRDKRFLKKVDRSTDLKHKVRSILCVPVKSSGKLLAVLEIFNKTKGESFTGEDLNELIKLSEKSAIFIERALLYQKVEELSVIKYFLIRHL